MTKKEMPAQGEPGKNKVVRNRVIDKDLVREFHQG